MGERENRVTKNEAVYRDLNERVRQIDRDMLGDDPLPDSDAVECFCECADPDCTVRLRVTNSEYESARRNPLAFIVREEHALPQYEQVVERHDDRFVVVLKTAGKQVARETNPRS